MTQRQLHLTGKYHKCLSASLLQTNQCGYLEYEWNKSRSQLKEAARFYNDLLVGKPLTDAVPSPPQQKISEIRCYLPPPTHIAPPLPPRPFPRYGKLWRRPTYFCHSDRQLVGLPTDLVIWQVLMRSIKTTGGLPKCQGMDESWRASAFWILSCPMHAEYNHTMQECTGVNCNTMSSTNIASCMPKKELLLSLGSLSQPDLWPRYLL